MVEFEDSVLNSELTVIQVTDFNAQVSQIFDEFGSAEICVDLLLLSP